MVARSAGAAAGNVPRSKLINSVLAIDMRQGGFHACANGVEIVRLNLDLDRGIAGGEDELYLTGFRQIQRGDPRLRGLVHRVPDPTGNEVSGDPKGQADGADLH